jgi:uncharacterized membrane protein
MNAHHQLSPEATAYLRSVERHLINLPNPQKSELLDGLASHIEDAIASGEPIRDTLARLGAPINVAEQAFEQYQIATGDNARSRYLSVKRVLQLVAAAVALAGAMAFLFLPSYVEVTQSSDGPDSIATPTVLEVMGPVAFLLAAVPIASALLPLFAKGKAWQQLSIASAAILTLYTVIGALSLGFFFFPATVFALVAVFLPTHHVRAPVDR